MDAAEVQQRLREGISAIRNGDRQRGRELLLQVVEADERNEPAWLWLSQAVDDPADQLVALENALTLNPHNSQAQARARHLRQQLGMQESPPPAPEPPARQTAPEPKPTVHLYTAVDPDDDPYQCVYCGQPTERADQRCPHCGRSLLVAGPWQGTGWRNGLLFVCGLVLQAAIFQLLGPVFRIAGAQGYDISLAVLLTRLPLVTSFLGDFPNWSEAEAYRHLIAGVVRLILWIVLFFMLYTDMDAAHPLGVALALADFAWAGAGYSLGYVPPLAAGLNALFDVFVLSVSAVATASRAQARVRQRVEIDRELFGAAAMDKRGHKYRREGKWALAALHWQKAVILSPREPQYYKDLAAAQMRLGRYEKALRTLETGVYHAPGDEEFKTLMEAVRAKAEGE